MGKRTWTTEQEELLKEIYPHTRKDDLICIFKRDYQSIKGKANRMGLRSEKYWSEEEICKLKGMYSDHSNTDLSEIFKRSPSSIEHQGLRLGLKKDKSLMYIRQSFYNRKYQVNHNYFSSIDNQDKAYILGFLLGDGNIDSVKYRIGVMINERDSEILDFMKIQLESGAPIHNAANSCKVLRISSYSLVKDLSKYNMIPRKTYSLELPGIRPDLMRHMIRGLFDADGSVVVSLSRGKYFNPSVTICGTLDVCNSILGIVREEVGILGGNVYSYDYSIPVITIGGRNQVGSFAQWLYKDAHFFLSRKHNKFTQAGLL